MKAPTLTKSRYEKVAAGWYAGCNSVENPWLLPDNQYRWSVNCVNRGGIVQTRPGFYCRLTLPAGNFQGMKFFKITRDGDIIGRSLVFAVDGYVYYAPFPLSQPTNWEPYRLKNIRFNSLAKQIYWCVTEKSVSQTSSGELTIVPTYSVLMMQDGITPAAYWDGTTDAHLDENAPNLQTPIGTWMAYSGSRLWVARGSSVIASDLLDPLQFTERTIEETRGDFKFIGEITGLANSIGDNRQSNLVVFTEENGETLLSSIIDRTIWKTTQNFQTLLFPSTGCAAGKSIVNHAGLLWWWSYGGLVNSDSAAAAFLTSQIRYRDVEMAQTKRNLFPDISGVCSASFESYLMMSIPSGDTLNAETMVLDYSVSDQLNKQTSPAWQGVWTGIRPVEWSSATIEGERKLYVGSVDYSMIPGTDSVNHIWEAFQPNRYDAYRFFDTASTLVEARSRIYCEFETKLLGDGMDYKRFGNCEADLMEVGDDVNLKISFAGTKGGYNEIFNTTLNAQLQAADIQNDQLQQLGTIEGYFKPQSRRVVSGSPLRTTCGVESTYSDNVDKAFGLRFQWCGRMGVESVRIYSDPEPEPSFGTCMEPEDNINVVTQDGRSFSFPRT